MKKQQNKTIKSFSELQKFRKRDFIKNNKLKRINSKLAISIAKQLATGFEKIDLRKEPNKYQIKKAKKYIKEFFEKSDSERLKLIRPTKKNRKYYADYADMNKNFKVYLMPVFDDTDIFKLNKKTKQLKRIGKFSDTEFYKFPNKKDLIKSPKKECKKIYNKIDNEIKSDYAVKIKCGNAEYQTLYRDKSPHIEIENWINIYGADKVKSFVLGLQVYTFKNQEQLPTKSKANIKKGEKKNKNTKSYKAKNKLKNKKKK